jgi:ubiquitin-like 1-activating enzyme E1 B
VILSFDKDDDDTLDFVLATANLRAIAYGIQSKTRFQVKGESWFAKKRSEDPTPDVRFAEMAGNIIPAIATTNAIVAGFIVMRALNLLRDDWSQCSNVFLRGDPAKPLGKFQTSSPNPACGVCADVYIPFACDPSRVTLGTFIGEVVRNWLGWKPVDEDDEFEISVFEEKRVLADPDFDDNLSRTLADLGVVRGKMLTVTDEDEKFANVVFAIAN